MERLSRFLPLLFLIPFVGCANVADRVARGVERGTERAAERETARAADRAATSVVRGMENAIVCIVTDTECIERAQRNGQPVVVENEDGEVVNQIPAPGSDVNVNPDFAPGQRVLFYEDFSGDPIGNFPSSLEFVNGNWEVAEWQGRRLLRGTGPRGAAFRIVLPEALPDSFTIDMDLYYTYRNKRIVLLTQPPANGYQSADYNYFVIDHRGTGVEANSGTGLPASKNPADPLLDGLVPVQIQVEGEYVKVYVGRDRVANVPNAILPRTEAIHVQNIYDATEEYPIYLGPIRIAATD